MQSQEIIIYAIIRKKAYEFLKPELIQHFSGPCKKLLEGAFTLKMRGLEPTIQYMTNFIDQDPDVKNKPQLINYMVQITKGEKYVDPVGIEHSLMEESWDNKFTEFDKIKSNPNSTLEMKQRAIMEMYELINNTRKIDDCQNVNKILAKFREAYDSPGKDDFMKRVIDVLDIDLARIFGNKLYPQPYGITAAPNDFKTSLLVALMNYLDSIKKRGLFSSLEDYAQMVAIKCMANLCGSDKGEMISHRYNTKEFDDKMGSGFGKYIDVMDKVRTADELYADLDAKLSTGIYSWFAIDYLQQGKKARYQSDYELVSAMDSVAFELCKKHTVLGIRLSQIPMDKIRNGAIIGMGDDKGSGSISQNSRYHISINGEQHLKDKKIEGVERRLINIFKTTFSQKGQCQVNFDGPSGKILDTFNV
jgi:hypothetical protein